MALVQLENGCIPHLPIGPSFVERLQSPPLAGPVSAHGRIAIVNLLDHVRNWLPPKPSRHVCSNFKINPRNKEISSLLHQACNVSQATFCSHRFHVAEKVVRYHHVLRPKNTDQFRIGDITKPPGYSLP